MAKETTHITKEGLADFVRKTCMDEHLVAQRRMNIARLHLEAIGHGEIEANKIKAEIAEAQAKQDEIRAKVQRAIDVVKAQAGRGST